METKPGLKTTEFWTMVFTNLINLINLTGAWDFSKNKYSVIAMAIISGLYFAGRGIAKSGVSPEPTP